MSVILRRWAAGPVPRGSRINVEVLLLLGQEWRIKRAQGYRNPVGKLTFGA